MHFVVYVLRVMVSSPFHCLAVFYHVHDNFSSCGLKLWDHYNQCATEMAEKLTERLMAERGITEALKQDEPVRWVREMNSVKAAVREIVCAEIIDVG